MRGPVSLLVLPGVGQVSNVWEGVSVQTAQWDGGGGGSGEYMTNPPVADHCSECGHNCHVLKDRESRRTSVRDPSNSQVKKTNKKTNKNAYYSGFRWQRRT